VLAVDSDRGAIEATLSNARANGVVLERVERWNLREQAPPGANVVAANLTRLLLLGIAERVVEPPGVFIASGLLGEEAGEVAAAFGRLGLRERRRLQDRGWCALLLQRDA
jgi:ribosomal protein L11 methylase PrmA